MATEPDRASQPLTRADLDTAVAASAAIIYARLDGMDKAVTLFQADLTRVPTSMDRAILGLRKLLTGQIEKLDAVTMQKFVSISQQFVERDTRTEQRAGDTKLAVDAAFAAAKESTAKIETGFSKSIESIQALLKTMEKSSDDKTSDLKDRITVIESRTQGREKGLSDYTAILIAVVAIAVSVVAIFVRR